MAHFAKVNSENIVENVLVVPDEQEHRGEEYLNELGLEGRWIQTSYNRNIRKNFAAIGMHYDPENDAFINKKPHNGWVLDDNFLWTPPVPMPNDGQEYIWNDDTESWEIYIRD